MNPLLLKPESDTASQVVAHGQADAALSRLPWRERSALLAPAAREGFDRLAARHGLIVVEGAGSLAEINLAPQDCVNLGTARWAQAAGPTAALRVSDIDRGGSFAHVHSNGPACRWPACCGCGAVTACPRKTACWTAACMATAPVAAARR